MPLVDDEVAGGEHGEKVPVFPVVTLVSGLLCIQRRGLT